ncbi:MAG: thioredoxin [Angustibacter sp.]
MGIRTTTDSTFDTDVLKSAKPVLVDFWAPWCKPCLAMSPILDEIAREYSDKIDVVKINTDENPQTATRYRIIGIPTINVYVNGEVVKSIDGAKPKPLLVRDLAEFID